MQYVLVGCPVCQTGVVGIRRCADGSSLVLMCDECETVWSSPDRITEANALEVAGPTFEVAELGVAIGGGSAGWATSKEISEKGWNRYVKGEQSAE